VRPVRSIMQRARFVPVVLSAALVALTGCGRRGDGTSLRGNEAAGNRPPERIVCGTPAIAEIVYALGCGDRVVGVSDHTAYPPEARATTRIGGVINPSRERLLVLDPDLILTQGRHERLAAFAAEYGIRFEAVALDTLADLYDAIGSIARTLGVADRGTTLAGDIRARLRAVSATVTGPPRRVLLLFSRAPGSLRGLGTVGAGSFLDDLLQVAGGTNIFADAAGAYPQVSKEALVVRKPETIVEINPGGLPAETVARLRADWDELADIPAVRHDRIHVLTNDFLLIPGPRVDQTAAALAAAIAAP